VRRIAISVHCRLTVSHWLLLAYELLVVGAVSGMYWIAGAAICMLKLYGIVVGCLLLVVCCRLLVVTAVVVVVYGLVLIKHWKATAITFPLLLFGLWVAITRGP
jgi:hypothetical protein